MLKILIKFVFTVVTRAIEAIATPLIEVVIALFPDLGTAFSYISSWLVYLLTYVPPLLSLMLVPVGAMTMLFDYWLIKYTIQGSVGAYKLAIKLYNKLKV